MELRQLRYFTAIADAGSFASAAQELRVAQPALSRSIAKLEDELQRVLFVRHSSGISMTDDGHRLYGYARQVLTDIRDLRESMDSHDGVPRGLIKLGAPQSIQSQLVLPVATEFLRTFELCRLDIIQNSGARLRDQVSEGLLDLAILPHTVESRVHVTPLARESICLICRADERDKFPASIALEDLLELPLILTGYPDSLRLYIERRFPHRADALAVRSEVNSSSSLIELVLGRIGLGVAPCCVVAQRCNDLAFVPIDGLDVSWVMATSWERRGLNAVRKLESLVIEHVSAQIATASWPTARLEQ